MMNNLQKGHLESKVSELDRKHTNFLEYGRLGYQDMHNHHHIISFLSWWNIGN